MSDEIDFKFADKDQSFLQVVNIFLMSLTRHAQSTQTSLPYLGNTKERS